MSILEQHKNVVQLMDKCVADHKSFKQTISDTYNAALEVYCPDYKTTNRASDEFQDIVDRMHEDLTARLVHRGMERDYVIRHLASCYRQIVCKSERFSLGYFPPLIRKEVTAKTESGMAFKQAYAEVLASKKAKKTGVPQSCVIRPRNQLEDINDFLRFAKEEFKAHPAEARAVAGPGDSDGGLGV
jgi:hypothetical protein